MGALIDKPAPPPARAFDNLYFLGDSWVSAWAIDTPAGIILRDALNSGKQAAELIEGGLRHVGPRPPRIKYIIVTHGHGDHYGGAAYLASQYGARVVMGDEDWKNDGKQARFRDAALGSTSQARHSCQGRRHGVARRHDGDPVPDARPYPGHDLARVRRHLEGRTASGDGMGGTGFNFGNDTQRLNACVASTERMRKVVAKQSIDVVISIHSGVDLAPSTLEGLRKAPGAPPSCRVWPRSSAP